MMASVLMASMIVPPCPSQLCPLRACGFSSSVPHAYFLYPSHECISAAFTALRRSTSAWPFADNGAGCSIVRVARHGVVYFGRCCHDRRQNTC